MFYSIIPWHSNLFLWRHWNICINNQITRSKIEPVDVMETNLGIKVYIFIVLTTRISHNLVKCIKNLFIMYFWYLFAYILIKSCRQYHSWAVKNEQTLVKQPTRALAAVSDWAAGGGQAKHCMLRRLLKYSTSVAK